MRQGEYSNRKRRWICRRNRVQNIGLTDGQQRWQANRHTILLLNVGLARRTLSRGVERPEVSPLLPAIFFALLTGLVYCVSVARCYSREFVLNLGDKCSLSEVSRTAFIPSTFAVYNLRLLPALIGEIPQILGERYKRVNCFS